MWGFITRYCLKLSSSGERVSQVLNHLQRSTDVARAHSRAASYLTTRSASERGFSTQSPVSLGTSTPVASMTTPGS